MAKKQGQLSKEKLKKEGGGALTKHLSKARRFPNRVETFGMGKKEKLQR